MNIPLFIFFIFVLQGICLFVARNISTKMTTSEDYFLASKDLTFFPLLMTLIATQVGGGIVLGATEEAYRFGWPVIFYPLGASFGLICLGLGLGRKLAEFRISTVAQIFEVVYRSPNLKKLASLLSIISLFMILVAQVIASNKFMISLGVSNPLIFISFWSIVIIYTVMGGLKAVVATDVVQALFFMIVFFGAMCLIGLKITPSDLVNLNTTSFDFSFSKMSGWLLMPLLFMVIEQDMGQRCFAAENPKIVSKATLFAALCTFLVGAIPVALGIFAKVKGIQAPEGGSVLMAVIETSTSPIFTALTGCAILAALISTSDSLINAISSNLSQDFDLKFLKKNIRTSQMISAIIAVSAIFISFSFNNVVDLLILSYELSVCCLFVPIFLAIVRKRGNSLAAGLAVGFGAAAFLLFRVYPIAFPKEILSILISFIGYSAGEIILRNQIANKPIDIN